MQSDRLHHLQLGRQLVLTVTLKDIHTASIRIAFVKVRVSLREWHSFLLPLQCFETAHYCANGRSHINTAFHVHFFMGLTSWRSIWRRKHVEISMSYSKFLRFLLARCEKFVISVLIRRRLRRQRVSCLKRLCFLSRKTWYLCYLSSISVSRPGVRRRLFLSEITNEALLLLY